MGAQCGNDLNKYNNTKPLSSFIHNHRCVKNKSPQKFLSEFFLFLYLQQLRQCLVPSSSDVLSGLQCNLKRNGTASLPMVKITDLRVQAAFGSQQHQRRGRQSVPLFLRCPGSSNLFTSTRPPTRTSPTRRMDFRRTRKSLKGESHEPTGVTQWTRLPARAQ